MTTPTWSTAETDVKALYPQHSRSNSATRRQNMNICAFFSGWNHDLPLDMFEHSKIWYLEYGAGRNKTAHSYIKKQCSQTQEKTGIGMNFLTAIFDLCHL